MFGSLFRKLKFKFNPCTASSSGFTLVELLLVMGLFSALAVLSSINLVRPHTTTRLDTAAANLISNLKQQQIRAMASDTGISDAPGKFGVHFEDSGYSLFSGDSYQTGDGGNFTIDLDSNLVFSTIDLPSESIIFSRLSGEVEGFDSNSRRIVLTDSVSGSQVTILINRLGAPEIQ